MLSNYSFNYQKGLLYGQLGKTDLMIEMFLDEAEAHLKTLLLFKISS
jgi:hypothetical protein